MKELIISKNDAGQRLDKFLTKALCDIPPALMYKAIRKKKIKVNRHRAEGKQVLAEGDTLQLFLPDEFFKQEQTGGHDLARITPRISPVYEDENILLLNKRPGILVHEDGEGTGDTLITHVQAYLYQKGEYDPREEQSFAPALCNRIDRNTGGIVIAAKNAEALRVINEKIRDGSIHKFYLCAVHGIPSPREATLSGYLMKNSKENTVQVYDTNPGRGAKDIRTRYRVLATRGGDALLEINLLTGRTHQIRAHMAHIGHPLWGDGKYGINRQDRARGYKFQALYAYRLCFDREGDWGVLNGLRGREFSISPAEIYFTKEFEQA
ncbi:MAG: RluA family pseudouridine synthase [Clostridia bacterium]|nr:RluA family pseudouridine synthase [Clostridia bacterium]